MRDFIDGLGLSAHQYDTASLMQSFFSEMDKGLANEESSLAMLHAYLSVSKEIAKNRKVIVVDAGGTNLRVGTAMFDDAGSLQIENFEKSGMIGLSGRVSKSEFFETLADRIMPVVNESDSIGFCFSYACEIQPNRDGLLLHWTKGVDAPEVVGCMIGEELNRVFEARGIARKKIVLLNDTVATLLAGVSEGAARGAKGYVGFILGTGTNTATLEKGEVINVESGGFDKLPVADIDREVDEASSNCGQQILEKMISGTYLGPLTLAALKKVPLSESGRQALEEMHDLHLIQIDNFAAQNGRDIGPLADERFSEEDEEMIRKLFAAVVTRAAHLSAVNLAAAAIRNGTSPVCINLDGSTYFKTFGLRPQVEVELKKLLSEAEVDYFCVHVDDAPIVGAAIAALSC
ncbi:hexokinase family protein [Tichowtungia aerotolerans]|uniref:Hexokinase n=1 Tax=Tichowtungia aerotolerans TaxID=2697043 RepID=A0A6P1M6L1_9BACT|nr:hexokinase [Tichowtungia aerotolerans]QHI69491.1 hexokinase [Tichowtungia aerotolerans]